MTEKVSQAYAKSQRVNPTDFLTDGETPETAKTRIIAVVTEVVKKGLSMRDGELHFGVSPQDMADAKAAPGLLKDEDANYMRHSIDGLVNSMGVFIGVYQESQMGPEKNQATQWKLKELDVTGELNKMANSHLKTLGMYLNNMYERGFDKIIQPRRRDNCGGGFGQQKTGVSAQVSMASHRTL